MTAGLHPPRFWRVQDLIRSRALQCSVNNRCANIACRHEDLQGRLQQLQGEYDRASAALDAAVAADGGELAAARAAAEAAAAEVIP